MADVIDLSTLKTPVDPEQAAYDALTDEQKAALDALAEANPEPEGVHVRTAFLIVVDEEGQVMVQPDLDYKVVRDSIPNADDIYGACQVISRDIAAEITAQQTVAGMQQFAMMQQQRMQQAAMAQRLNLPK